MTGGQERKERRRRPRCRSGFTLIELLTVVAIITLLVGILVPAIAKAREKARRVTTRAQFDVLGKGLAMFKNEVPAECPGDGYPASGFRGPSQTDATLQPSDDPTEEGYQFLSGAQWMVRYLVGKDLQGYAPKRNAPRSGSAPVQFHEQNGWYENFDLTMSVPAPRPRFSRAPRFVDPQAIRLKRPAELDGAPVEQPVGESNMAAFQQPVSLDAFGYPILYYAANVRGSSDGNVALASMDFRKRGVYRMLDNGRFTGLCEGREGASNSAVMPAWNFHVNLAAGEPPPNPTKKVHEIQYFGNHSANPADPLLPSRHTLALAENERTFPYFILNKATWESSSRQSTIPYRPTSYLMISAGPDGFYGTADDLTNFE